MANTNLDLDLHSSSAKPVNFFGAQSSLGGAQFSFGGAQAVIWGARPRNAPLPVAPGLNLNTALRNFLIILSLYTRCITPQCVTSLWGPISASLRLRATQLFSKKCPAVASRWQHRIQFDRSEILTSDLLFLRLTRCRSIN